MRRKQIFLGLVLLCLHELRLFGLLVHFLVSLDLLEQKGLGLLHLRELLVQGGVLRVQAADLVVRAGLEARVALSEADELFRLAGALGRDVAPRDQLYLRQALLQALELFALLIQLSALSRDYLALLRLRLAPKLLQVRYRLLQHCVLFLRVFDLCSRAVQVRLEARDFLSQVF